MTKLSLSTQSEPSFAGLLVDLSVAASASQVRYLAVFAGWHGDVTRLVAQYDMYLIGHQPDVIFAHQEKSVQPLSAA